jgi:PAS domain-containing protein
MLPGRSGNPLPDLRLMLDSSGDGVYGLDTLGRCTLVNRAAAELFGYTTSDAILPEPYRALDLRALLVRSTALSDGEAA